MNRRTFIETTLKTSLGSVIALSWPSCSTKAEKAQWSFEISLAQWSLHRTIRSGNLDPLDFPAKAQQDFGIHAVEYVNQFFLDKAKDMVFLTDLKTRASDTGVENLLIMIDAEGDLGNPVMAQRLQAAENHYKWVEAAQFLSCHSIRVNAGGNGEAGEVAKAATESLHQLAMFAKDFDINVIVENHGSYSSNGKWLSAIMREVALENCGTLPDFGNFYEYDRYQGVEDLMPFAKGVSAKTHLFDADGNETEIDYVRMLQIVKDSGYSGYIGIEYEGPDLDEDKGILATKKLLLKAALKVT